MTLPDFTEHGYQVIQELGYNQYGGRTTYLAVDRQSQKQVVIKEFCFAQRGSAWAGYEAHQREIRVLEQLHHPRIPRYLDSFETDYGFCLVQEYKDAPSLAQKNDFKPEEIKKIALSILEILADLQSRKEAVFHRDIKPENILVDRDLNAYLIDFGLARIDSGSRTITVVVAGTPGFMPHEQLHDLQLTKASDLYSLGATLICLLTKTPSYEIGQLISPQGSFNFVKIPPLHPDFIRWLKKMVAPDSKNRFPDAKTALDKLSSIRIEGLSLPEKLGNSWMGLRQNKLLKSAAIIAIVGGVAWFGIPIVTSKIEEFKITERQRIERQNQQEEEAQKQRESEWKRQEIEGQKLIEAIQKHEEAAQEREALERQLLEAKQNYQELQKQWAKAAQEEAGAELIKDYYKNEREQIETKLRQMESQLNRIEPELQQIKIEEQKWLESKQKYQKIREQRTKEREQNAQRLIVNKKCVGCDLQNVDLTNAELQGVDLRGANLKGAKLPRNLKKIILERANLEEIDLSKSSGYNSKYFDLENANLKRANLKNANLGEANLSNANLQNANLENAGLGKANLSYTNLQNANLQDANLVDTNFKWANLKGADLRKAYLENANFDRANLEGANLEGAKGLPDFGSANLKNATMPDGKKYEEWIENQ